MRDPVRRVAPTAGSVGHLTGGLGLESPPLTPTEGCGELELCSRHDRRTDIEAGSPWKAMGVVDDE